MTAIPADGTKVYLDSAGDDPKLARPELADLVDKFNALLAHLRASGLLSDASAPASVGDGLEISGNALRVKLNGSSIDRSSSGIKVANSGVTANTYAYPTSVTVGADGRVTSMTGGSAPTPGWVPLAEIVASASASIDLTSVITATYDAYVIVIDKLRPSVDQAGGLLRVSTDNGSTWKTTSYMYANTYTTTGASSTVGATSGLSITFTKASGSTSSPGNGTTDGISGHITIWPNGSAKHKSIKYQIMHNRDSNPDLATLDGAGVWRGTTAVNAVQLLPTSGNWTSGNVRIYGIKNS